MSDVKIRVLAEDKASAAINQVDKSLDKLAADANIAGGKTGLGGLSASLGTTLTSVMGLVGGIGILAGAFAKTKAFIFDSINSTVEYAQAVRELSMAIGINAEETSRLIQLADDYMIDTTKMATALRFATKNGFEVSIDSIARLADELRGIADPNERAAKLVEIFGRNWSALIPLLNSGGDAIRKNAAAIQEGLIIDDATTAGVFAYQQALDNLNDTIEATKIRIGTGLLPALTDLLVQFNQGATLGDQMSASFKAFNGIIDQSNRSALAFETAFKQGFDVSPEGLTAIAEQLQAIEDPMQRVILAQQMFGENWVEVYAIFEQSIPVLEALSGLISGIGPDMNEMLRGGGVSGMAKKLGMTEDAALQAADAEEELEGATKDTTKALEEAIGPATNLTQAFYGIATAAITAAHSILAVKSGVSGFSDMDMNITNAAEAFQEQVMWSEMGMEAVRNNLTVLLEYADGLKLTGQYQGEAKTQIEEAIQMIYAEGEAYNYLTGQVDRTALREFAQDNQYLADAMGAVYARAIEIGEVDYSQAAREISRGLNIPIGKAQDLLDKFAADAQFSVTASVVVNIVAQGDLWALGLAGTNLRFGVPNPALQYSRTGNQYAQGADFIVPGGSPADTFPVWVSSGERVTVTPANKVAGDTYYDIQINSMPSQSPSEIANSVVWKLNEHQRLSRAAGAGYAGR